MIIRPIFTQPRRGQVITLTGTPLDVELQLAKLEAHRRLLGAVYTRKNGRRSTTVHAEVI